MVGVVVVRVVVLGGASVLQLMLRVVVQVAVVLVVLMKVRW